jgi:hypothetical protein
MMTKESDALAYQELLDKEAIRDCLMRYCHGIDRCDEDLVLRVYWPEATDDHGMFSGPASDFVAAIMPILRKMDATAHFLGNIWIRLAGNAAKVETYVQAYHRSKSSTGVMRDSVIGGRYLDRMEKRGSEWRILARAVTVDWCRQYPDSADWNKTKILMNLKPSGRRPHDRFYDFFDESDRSL